MRIINYSILLLIAPVILITSCDNTLEPIDRDTGIYGIYGYLDLNEDVSYIRVRDLNAPFTIDATTELDAVVTLSNLTSGTSAVLESNIREYEGVLLHTYFFDGEVVPDSEYQLSVERSDGATVRMKTLTPTFPPPVATPVNQDCYTPIDVEFAPLNEGTIVLRVGLGPEDDDIWGPPKVFEPEDYQPGENLVFQFTPNEEIFFVSTFEESVRCGDVLEDNNFYISYTHYAEGFYEQIANDPFDILQSTQRFGALYRDTVLVPVDISKVCPQDCE